MRSLRRNENVSYGMSVVCLAACVILVYMAVSLAVAQIGLSAMVTNLICNCLALVAGLVWYFYDQKKNPVFFKKEPLKMSIFGWFVVLAVFVFMYLSSQVLGNYLWAAGPQIGLTSDYANMSNSDLYWYVFTAVTVAPIVEELFFRKFIFAKLRMRFSFTISFVISTLFFMVFHGTIMHIPLALGISLVTCIFYDITGKFRWSLFFHILFNYLAASYVIVMQMPVWVACIVYAVSLTLFILAYVYQKQVFGKYLKAGGLEQFEAFLDEKRKHFETLYETADGAESEQKSED